MDQKPELLTSLRFSSLHSSDIVSLARTSLWTRWTHANENTSSIWHMGKKPRADEFWVHEWTDNSHQEQGCGNFHCGVKTPWSEGSDYCLGLKEGNDVHLSCIFSIRDQTDYPFRDRSLINKKKNSSHRHCYCWTIAKAHT